MNRIKSLFSCGDMFDVLETASYNCGVILYLDVRNYYLLLGKYL